MAKGRSANGAEFGRYTLPIILNLPLPTFTFAHILSYTPGMKDDSISRTSYSNLLSMNNPTQLICICITFKPCIHSFVLTVGQTSASLYSLEGVFFKWDPLKVSIDRQIQDLMAQFNDTLKEVLVKKHPVNAEFAQFTVVQFQQKLH